MKKAFACFFALLLLLSSCTGIKTDGTAKTDTAGQRREPQPTDGITENSTHADYMSDIAVTADQTAPADTPAEKTSAPVIKGYTYIEPGVVMVYGKCAADCGLIISSEGSSYTVRSDGEDFVFPVYIDKNGDKTVLVTASADGMEKSEPVELEYRYEKSAEDKGVAVTYGSRVIEKKVLPDLYGSNAFTEKELETVKKNAAYRVKAASEAAGKRVDIIYIVVPDPMTVYPEEMTDEMMEKTAEPSKRMKQAVKALAEVDGVTVIDLTDTLVQNKNSGKLYYKLDSHWTQLGAYYGYAHIMNVLGAAPRPLSDYEVIYKSIDDTDMNVYSGVGTGKMYEVAPFLQALFEEKTPYGKENKDTARIWDYANASL